MKTVSQIVQYPIKSCKGNSLNKTQVTPRGMTLDRRWAIFDKEGKCLTGRDFPQLMDLRCEPTEQKLNVYVEDEKVFDVPLKQNTEEEKELKIFSYDVKGSPIHPQVNQWVSNFLNTESELVFQQERTFRPVLEKHGGATGDKVSFADQCPLLLTTEASLIDLNKRLNRPIGMERFRPNLVIKGTQAYEEENWSIIQIGECVFRISQSCQRCVFTTIDPVTKTKDPNQEPLRTLATYQKDPRGGVKFGMHLIPIETGVVKVGDKLIVME